VAEGDDVAAEPTPFSVGLRHDHPAKLRRIALAAAIEKAP
jgi:hypothetical protein